MLKMPIKILIFILSIVPALLLGQTNNFEFVQYDTAYVGSEDFIIQHGDVLNLSATPLFLTVTRVEHQKPATWSTSFCFNGHCLPPFIEIDTSTVLVGDTAAFSLDTWPYSEPGIGAWTIFIADSATMEVDSAHITIEFVTVSVDDEISIPKAFSLSNIFPNPTNAWINFNLNVEHSGQYSIILHSLDGREIVTRDYSLRAGINQLQWGMHDLPSGNYIISAISAGRRVSKQIVVIK